MGLWKGASAFVDAHFSFSGGGSADAGDFQGISSISTGGKNIHQISQLWYQQTCWDDTLRFKLGKIDASTEFNFISVAGDFLNSSGINTINTLSSIPTYPNPATGVVAFVYPTETVYVGAGLFDGATLEGFPTGPRGPSTFFSDSDAESWFLIGEGGASWDPDFGKGRLALGVWHHTAEFTAFDSSTVDGNTGVYAMIEQQVWRRSDAEDDRAKGLTVFAHVGFSDEDVTAAPFSFAAGAVLKGTFGSRSDDAAGLLVGHAGLSDASGSPFTDDETVIEAYYKLQLTPSMSLTPDIQYVLTPAGDPTVDDAFVAAVRLAVTF